jgi:hypothetical protein
MGFNIENLFKKALFPAQVTMRYVMPDGGWTVHVAYADKSIDVPIPELAIDDWAGEEWQGIREQLAAARGLVLMGSGHGF